MPRKIIATVACVALALLLVREVLLLPDGKLHLYMFDVGQGDAIFVVTPNGKQILIDGGPDLAALTHLGSTMSFFDRSIDLVVLSHSDADHITALPEVLRRYHVNTLLLSGRLSNSGSSDALVDAAKTSGTRIILADPHNDLTIDGVVLDIVWPTHDALQSGRYSNNDLSVVMRLLYEENAVLLTGDIEAKAERAILRTSADVRSSILKVAHHGSKTSTTSEFLRAVDPELALISAGRDNQYGHPHASVTDRLTKLGIPIKSTAEDGVLSLEF